MHVEVVTMTPEAASNLLSKNTHNRRINTETVATYASAMKEDRWLQGGADAIKIAPDGTILNGQHTLTAITQAEVPIEVVIYKDVPEAAQEVMDTGLKRSFSNALHMSGESDPNNLAACTNMLYYWDQGLRGSGLTSMGGSAVKRAQIPQLMAFFQDNRDDIRGGVLAATKVRKQVRVSTRILSLSHIVFNRLDTDDTAFFFDRLETGEQLAKTDAIYQLRKRLQEESLKLSTGRLATSVLLGLTMKAWNLYRDGEEVQVLVYRPGGSSKESFPEPH